VGLNGLSVLIAEERDTIINSNDGLADAMGGVILFLAALCFPFVLIGTGIIMIVAALIPGLFKQKNERQHGKTVVVWHYKPSPPE
jgi:hypothetical protein